MEKYFVYAVAKSMVLLKVDVLKYIPSNNRDYKVDLESIPEGTDFIQFIETSRPIKEGKSFPRVRIFHGKIIPVGKKITIREVKRDKNWKYQSSKYENYEMFIKTVHNRYYPITKKDKEGKDFFVI